MEGDIPGSLAQNLFSRLKLEISIIQIMAIQIHMIPDY